MTVCGAAAAAFAETPFVPSFWDPNRRLAKPDVSSIHLIRFITADDYPPFNFTLPDGSLVGFNVDLARALCEDLKVACTIQARRWDTIEGALEENKGDALIASIAMNEQTREKMDFTAPYFILPGRFVARAGKPPATDATPEKMGASKVGVIAGSAHEAWLKTFFPKLTLSTYPSADAARAALVKGDVDAVFGDAVSLGLWINGAASQACCAFFGGPFINAAYFGPGIAIGVRKNNIVLRRALDYGLAQLAERGVYAEIYLKYFPVGVF
ncbi:MAG: transporter substrate-binding domain-containing protein [Hyphomicrobiales bacterium]|nr:transporter substrate-binding domain-containing protein [Hyphomicrobiales bacterium]